jgi:hypothetical protein
MHVSLFSPNVITAGSFLVRSRGVTLDVSAGSGYPCAEYDGALCNVPALASTRTGKTEPDDCCARSRPDGGGLVRTQTEQQANHFYKEGGG